MEHERREMETPDGCTLRVEQWTPPGEVRCVVVVSHGAGEHVGRYGTLAADLESIGAFVVGPDHRGQGESGGKPGHIESFDVYGQDLAHVMRTIVDERPDDAPGKVPWFVFAHSMGGLIALNAIVGELFELPLRGAVVSGPLLRVAMPTPVVKLWLGKMAAVLAPKLTLPSGIPAEFICRDPEEVARYEADPRRAGVVSARWFQRMNQAAERVRQGLPNVRLPLHWYVGTGDKICDHTASVEAFDTLQDPDGYDQTFRAWDGYYHELHNEPAELRAPVIASIREWFAERLD